MKLSKYLVTYLNFDPLFLLAQAMFPDESLGEIPQLPPLVFIPTEEEKAAEPDFGAALEGKHRLDVVFCLRPRPHDGEG